MPCCASQPPARAPSRIVSALLPCGSWDVWMMVLVLFSAAEVPLEVSYGLPESRYLTLANW